MLEGSTETDTLPATNQFPEEENMATATIRYPHIKVRLVGEDGNAYAIMGRVSNALKRAGVPQEEVDAYFAESTSGDYDNLLRTAMAWVNCDGMGDDEPVKHYTKSLTTAMEGYWAEVEDAVEDAHLIAFDTCHKIYLAMDEEQAEWFLAEYPETYIGTPKAMLARLHEWYDQSCGLKFIQAVTTDHDDPNAGYESLIPQGAEQEGCCDECGDEGIYSDGLCQYCWESEEQDEEDEDEDY